MLLVTTFLSTDSSEMQVSHEAPRVAYKAVSAGKVKRSLFCPLEPGPSLPHSDQPTLTHYININSKDGPVLEAVSRFTYIVSMLFFYELL